MDVLLIFLFPKEKKTVCSKCVVFNSCCFIFITNHLSLYSKKKKFDQLSINRSIDWFRALEIDFFGTKLFWYANFLLFFVGWFHHCKSSFVLLNWCVFCVLCLVVLQLIYFGYPEGLTYQKKTKKSSILFLCLNVKVCFVYLLNCELNRMCMQVFSKNRSKISKKKNA